MRLNMPEIKETELNLIPIMNLFTALIPFLLLSAVFFKLSVIQVTIPVASESGENDVAKDDDKVTLTIQLQRKKFIVNAKSDTLSPQDLSGFDVSIARDAQAPLAEDAFIELAEHVYKIKTKYPMSEQVILVPHGDTAYEEIVASMDAVRVMRRKLEGRLTRVVLFPKVVLASKVGG